MNFYSHHIGDYAAATRHLSMLEHGAYRLLLDVYYKREEPFPASEAAVCRLAGARTDDEREAVVTVLREFFDLTDEGWTHARCDEEIQRYREKCDKARKSVAQRRDRQSINDDEPTCETIVERSNDVRSTNVQRTYNERTTNDLLTKNQEPREREARTSASRGTRLPPDWEPPDELLRWAMGERPDLDVQSTIETFRDHWKAAPGAKGVKLDWEATFRNWVRKEFVPKKGVNGSRRDDGIGPYV